MTGTPEAYRPPGSLLNPDAGKMPLRDYEPWQPS
jgi:NADH:ubiquinone oxidoreductase subunit